MRVAVIFGLGSYEKDLRPFQRDSRDTWLIGLPANASDADAILIFGGDGTVHRHLPHLVRLQLPVLVVPCGSGNDFARALGLRSRKHSLEAWKRFSSGGGNVRSIDLGIITEFPDEPQGLKPRGPATALGTAEAVPFPDHFQARHQHYFCCVGGLGLDSEVARRANQLPRWLRAHGGYVASLLPSVLSFAAFPVKISVPGNAGFIVHSDRPTVLGAFANAPAYGGGMKIAPQAKMDDGLLDVCIVSDINKFKLFCLFPTVYFGRHLAMPQVEYFQSNSLRIETEKPLDVYADGEYVCQTPVEMSVASAALQVIAPD